MYYHFIIFHYLIHYFPCHHYSNLDSGTQLLWPLESPRLAIPPCSLPLICFMQLMIYALSNCSNIQYASSEIIQYFLIFKHVTNDNYINNSFNVTSFIHEIFFFFTLSTLVLLGASHVLIKTVQWSRSSAALAGSVHRLSGPSVVLILGQVKR